MVVTIHSKDTIDVHNEKVRISNFKIGFLVIDFQNEDHVYVKDKLNFLEVKVSKDEIKVVRIYVNEKDEIIDI